MKIAQIIYTGFGGLGSVAFSIIEADAEKTHDWSIGFIGDLPLDEAYPLRCRQNDVDYGEFRSTPGRPYLAWWRLFRWLAKTRPDAILLHSINSILPARLYCWLFRARLVAVEHTSLKIKGRMETLFSKMCMVLADRIVLLTPEYRQGLEQVQGRLFRPGKVSVIANGIDLAVFSPGPRVADGVIRLGMASRITASKRHDILVDMMRVLAEKPSGLSFVLDFAGDGEGLAALQERVEALSLGGRVIFSGLLDEARLAGWFRQLDIYVHASDGETLSTAILQAMACELPIVASDCPGITNLLGEGPDALGVLAGNTGEAFADAVQGLVADDEKRKAMAARARKACETRYSNRAMFENYVALLKGRAA